MPLLPGGVLPPGEPTIDLATAPQSRFSDSVAVAKLKAQQAAEAPAPAPAPAPADLFAGLQEVSPEEAAGPDAFAGLQEADDLDLEDVATLTDNDAFNPGRYAADNPGILADAEKSKKLLDVYRARRIRGLEFGKVAKAAFKESPGIVIKTVKGVGDLIGATYDFAVRPAANAVLGAMTGTTAGEQADIQADAGRKQLKAAAEVTAGTDSAITGLAQLGQQGFRKVFGKSPKESTDSELLNDLLMDAEFTKSLTGIGEGQGEANAFLGLDAERLSKDGIVLDRDAIERLSLVDPVTLVATGGAFKVVGAAGKVLATAGTKIGAESVITGIKSLAAGTVRRAGKAGAATAGATRTAVKAVPAEIAGTIIGAITRQDTAGALIGGILGKRVQNATAKALEQAQNLGKGIEELGKVAAPGFTGPLTRGNQILANIAASKPAQVATGAIKGAAIGTVAAAPLALLSDDDTVAGSIIGGGAVLGAGAGGLGAVKTIAVESIAKNYIDPSNIRFEPLDSPAYGVEATLDRAHKAASEKLTPNEKNMVDTFREALRPAGGEIYALDNANYLDNITAEMQRTKGAEPLTPEEVSNAETYAKSHAFFDGTLTDAQGNPRRVVFLNGDAKGLPHDAGHLFHSLLSPERQLELRESVRENYSPAQLDAFAKDYTARLGDPEFFNRLGEVESKNKIADEIVAENYGQLFRNAPLADLKAAPGFSKKLAQTALDAGERLGFDLTGDRVTADLQVKPSFRLQGLLRNAAREVLSREAAPFEGPQTQPPTAAPAAPAAAPVQRAPIDLPPPRSLGMAESTPITPQDINPASALPTSDAPITPQNLKPTSKSIRNTSEELSRPDESARRATETGIAEAQRATEGTPEVRATVDKIAESMQAGNPALKIEHLGFAPEKGAANPEGRTSRRSTQKEGAATLEELQIENRKDAPADIIALHEKVFVPVRFSEQGGKVILMAMSFDKVITNIRRVVADAVSKGAAELLPYAVEGGKLTRAAWKQALSNLQAYAENQANGFRGDGQRLNRPTEDIGLSIPAENPNYTPKLLTEAQMNFANLVQGLAPSITPREVKGTGPANPPSNIKGQILAEVNAKQPATPSVIDPDKINKQDFKSFPGRSLKETNPLRNELAARGVKVRELLEVTERINVKDIASVTPRPDIDFKAPVTDTTRAGFLPGENNPLKGEIDRRLANKKAAGMEINEILRKKTQQEVEFDQRNGRLAKPPVSPASFFLAGEDLTVRGKEILSTTPDRWKELTDSWEGGLTAEAYRTGLGLKDIADVAKLAELRDEATAMLKEKMAEGDFDNAYPYATKSQFFSEALGAATDTGSAANPRMGWRRQFSDMSPPFPNVAPPATKAAFLPGENNPLKGEIDRRLANKKAAGMEINEILRKKTQQEVEFDQRNGRLAKPPVSPASFFLPGTDPVETAAIRLPSGKVYTGRWHGEAMMSLMDDISSGTSKEKLPAGVKTLSDFLEGDTASGFVEDGFLTRNGEFLNRAEALDRTEQIGQLKREEAGKFQRAGVLESDEFSTKRAFLPASDVKPKNKKKSGSPVALPLPKSDRTDEDSEVKPKKK